MVIKTRYNIIRGGILLVFVILLARIFYIQIIDNQYTIWAINNSVRTNTLYPNRGEIYDRNGLLLAQSKEAFDLYITPIELKAFDTARLAAVLNIETASMDSLIRKARNYSYRKPSILVGQLDQPTKLKIDELNIKGLQTVYRSMRSYPFNTGGNILGYIGTVSRADLENDEYYDANDIVGKSGIESSHEKYLRGEKGVEHKIVNVHGVEQSRFKDGQNDYKAIPGNSVTTTIDLKLQKTGEELMNGKIGSIVALDPATGEILALISSPTYNPDMLIGRQRNEHFRELTNDPRKPFYNRTSMASYPPGSTFKMVVGLIGLQEGIIDWNTQFTCYNGFHYGTRVLKCHSHYSPLSLEFAIQTSCNSFFCNTFLNFVNAKKFKNVKEGFDKWAEYVRSFGFGQKLDTDLPGELNGYIPNSAFYDRIHKGRWNGLSALSVSIGQGEILVTQLQLANLTAILANRGYYYTPHIVKKIDSLEYLPEQFRTKRFTMVDQKHFEPVVNAMWKGVNVAGTGTVARVEGLDICGKTGTAQNSSGEDHSTFVAFAPRNKPKIAICVYIENGGFGASVAAPIASMMIEQYLTDTIKRTTLFNDIKEKQIYYKQYAAR